MDRRALVEKANLNYLGTVKRSEEGLPLGNGTIGTLLWTSPASVKIQVNRVDVYANGNKSNSFIEPHEDYAYACANIDLDMAGYGGDVFDGTTRQTLNIYDAVARVSAHQVDVESFAAEDIDAFMFRLNDQRTEPEGMTIRLKALRNTFVRTRSHVALTDFKRIGDIAVMRQEFIEEDYYCASAVAIKVLGRSGVLRIDNERNTDESILPRSETYVQGQENETVLRMLFKPENGCFDVIVASAASYSRDDNVIDKAIAELEKAEAKGYDALKKEHEDRWHEFWEKSYVRLWGNENAEKLSVHYTYFFYVMRSCSRNKFFAPNYGGLLFSSRGDRRSWGNMQWWNNLNLTYNAMLPAGYEELLEPYFNMYFNMYEASQTAARQQWGAEGIYIGETTNVWGPEELPEDIAAELRDLLLCRKPWSERSPEFMAFARKKNSYEPRWNFLLGLVASAEWKDGELVFGETPYGSISYVSHIFGSMANLAYHYWLTYEYTNDEAFLKEKAYPMLRGVAEFFRTYPNLIREDDGYYHVHYSNHGEGFWGARDTLDTLSGMYGVLPTVIFAARKLNVDEDKIPLWEDLLEHLTPLPTSADTSCPVPRPSDGSVVWVGARSDALCRDNRQAWPNPVIYCDLCNLQTEEVNPEWYKIGKNTIDFLLQTYGQVHTRFFNEMSSATRVFAQMGYGDYMLDNAIRQLDGEGAALEHCFFEENGSQAVYQNRLTAREGINAMSAQRLGNVAAGLQLGLLQCSGGAPTLDPVIRVFPAWKADWNAEFELHARGGFIVSAKQEDGIIEYVRVHATRDQQLTLINPWKKEASAEINGVIQPMSGDKFSLMMKAGDTVVFRAEE